MARHKRIATLWRRLEASSPFIRSSVVVTRKPCIRETCPTCKSGRKHESCYLAVSRKGKSRVRYLPKRLVQEARRRALKYRETKAILDEMSEIWTEELLDTGR